MPIRAPAVRRAPALSVAVVSALLFALAAVAQAQAQQRTFKIGGPDELWDTTMKMEMPGMPMAMPAQTSQVCLKKNRKAEDAIPKQDDCRVTDMKTVGNKVIYTMDCAGKDPMIIHGEITSTPTSYEGKMRMKGKRKGDDMEMTQTFSGKKVGACTDQSEQVIASANAQMEAEVAKTCAEGLDKLYSQMFFGQGAMCANQQKQFCEKVGGIARDLRDPAAHRAAIRKSTRENVQQAMQSCKQDYAAATRIACDKAAQTKDYAFLGTGWCDEQVRALGPTHCQGRDYYLVDRSLIPLCNRYSFLIKGSVPAGGMPTDAKGSGQQQAAPAPAKPDPMKQGVDAVRKLLPF